MPNPNLDDDLNPNRDHEPTSDPNLDPDPDHACLCPAGPLVCSWRSGRALRTRSTCRPTCGWGGATRTGGGARTSGCAMRWASSSPCKRGTCTVSLKFGSLTLVHSGWAKVCLILDMCNSWAGEDTIQTIQNKLLKTVRVRLHSC